MMLLTLGIGSLMTIGNMLIQILAVVFFIRLLMKRIGPDGVAKGLFVDVQIISLVVAVLFAGHVAQFATWAFLFVLIGEFSDFPTAFYFSTVNFTSLGYGDIVMSEQWRLLGALEAANGVLMFGLSAGTILSVMNRLFSRYANQKQAD